MIDYHRKKDFENIEIGTRMYAHNSGFSGNVVDVFLKGEAIPGIQNTIILEISEKSYGDHKHYKPFMELGEEDVFHVCDREKDLTPKPIKRKEYLFEDTADESVVGLTK